MGWNTLTDVKSGLFSDQLANKFVYFVHSYYVPVNEHTVATTDYIANGLAVKQFVNIHEYQNLIPSNGDFENSAIASYGAPWFPGWEVPVKVFDQMQATPVDNGIYGQAAKFVCIADKLYQQVAKHKDTSNLLANIQSAGAGQYLVAVDAWADAEYAKLKFYPRLALNYGSTTVNLDGVQIPFAATSQTSSAVVNIDMEKDGVALSGATFSIMKSSTAVGYVCTAPSDRYIQYY
jgi:hypothetical protein